MHYRTLQSTDIKLSEVGFGVWGVATGWWGKVDKQDAVKLIRKSVDLGINFFDTANVYGQGYGEEILYESLHGYSNDLVIATKFGYDISAPRSGHHQERPQRWDKNFIRASCESSLKRLHRDYIDLYQLHNPRLTTLQQDSLFEELDNLKNQGKIRYYAVAIGPDLGWLEEGKFAIDNLGIPIQMIYSVIEQEPARQFINSANQHSIGLITRVPHASGILDGTYTKDTIIDQNRFGSSDHRSHRRLAWFKRAINKLQKLDILFDSIPTATVGQIAIRFCLQKNIVASCLPTITSDQQLEEYVGASNLPKLSSDVIAEVENLYNNNFYQTYKESMRSSISESGWTNY